MKQNSVHVHIPSCFLSEHRGFCGTIKERIGDFVVIELDSNGDPVNGDAPGLPRDTGAPRRCEDPEEVQQSADWRSDPAPSSLDLSVVLGQSVSEQLEQFVVNLRDEELEQKELSLGSFSDKYQRANVHRAVRHRFPFLMTVTIQPEIRVREDPDYKALSQLVSEAEAEDFFRFIDAKVQDSSYSFHADASKEHRTAVHHFLNRRFGKLVETKSLGESDQTFICARLRERGRARKRSLDERRDEEVYTGECVSLRRSRSSSALASLLLLSAFTLQKQNLETLEAVSHMAATLGVLPSDFTYAGIKDKRAVTFQSMVVKKVSPQRLREKRGELERRGMFLSHVRSVSQPLRLGRLRGNHFDLVVRNLRPHGGSATGTLSGLAPLVDEAVENVKVPLFFGPAAVPSAVGTMLQLSSVFLQTQGFVNYYGPQRFGTTQSVQSDRVGLALLQNDMVGALRLFFSPEEGDDAASEAKRHFLLTGNAKETLALMPLSKVRERLMLRALNRFGSGPDGCTQAWLSLPHSSRVFYPHAYCSRVWNEAASQRLFCLGPRAREGDLVWTQRGDGGPEGSRPAEVHVVTRQEEEDGVYTLRHVRPSCSSSCRSSLAEAEPLFQVLLPMAGNTVKYPTNIMAAWYQERLARDGLQNCHFRVTCLKLNLPGCYRPLLANMCNLSYRLQSGEVAAEGRGGTSVERGGPTLVLNFDLDSSCYATVGLREMMKCDL
ncbi:LOW QUALITY PROTEIN: pseudouridylate synthase PUS7L-like [Neosynchiropus ocellatus]